MSIENEDAVTGIEERTYAIQGQKVELFMNIKGKIKVEDLRVY
jgi:hypothetical protein